MRTCVSILACATLLALPLRAQWSAAERVTIPSSADGVSQRAYYYDPLAEFDVPIPLVVALHSWSTDYTQAENAAFLDLAASNGFALIHPDFRGPNVRPEAGASDLVISDIRDAVGYAQARRNIDPERVYLVGASGGGFTALAAAARAPDIWAGVSAWVPISDLEQWHAFSRAQGTRYAGDIEAIVGGDPNASAAARAEARSRSPRCLLDDVDAYAFSFDINVGIRDGLVQPSQSLLAFNALAAPRDTFAAADLAFLDEERVLPPDMIGEAEEDDYLRVLLRRRSRGHRVTVFEGGHVINRDAGIAWLLEQRRDESSGVGEVADLYPGLRLAPNPTDGAGFRLADADIGAAAVLPLRVRVFDGLGREVSAVSGGGGQYYGANLTPGFYAVAIDFPEGTVVRRLNVLP